jgi:17beta-estradiol 17-dehydrogenase / very-long-chain 3-oxoacyl-CoA reductase
VRYFFWICIFLGAIKALIYGIEIINFIIRHLPRFRKAGYLLERYGGAGSWAVVTGASDGIGAEYTRQLAREGFNVVLVSRTLTKLKSVEAELK